MNIKLGNKLLRFRVSRDELDNLLSHHYVTLTINISEHHTLRFEIVAVEKCQPILQLIQKKFVTQLQVDQEALAHLKTTVPAKEGLSSEWVNAAHETIQLIFEVDVRRKPAL